MCKEALRLFFCSASDCLNTGVSPLLGLFRHLGRMVQLAGGDLTRILEPGSWCGMGKPELLLREPEGGTGPVCDERKRAS